MSARQGKTTRGRARAKRQAVWKRGSGALPLLSGRDHGAPVLVRPSHVLPVKRDRDADLERVADSLVGQLLLVEARRLLSELGPGLEHRPTAAELQRACVPGNLSIWLTAAIEAMGWVTEERGLGGARSLDGLPWSLAADQLWEAWVERVLKTLAPRIGATLVRRGEQRWPLAWQTPLRSMTSLAPDLALRRPDRVAWVDAKYKAHLMNLQQHGWWNASDTLKEAHRADIHQALAYATLADTDRVDTILAYPVPSDAAASPSPHAIANLTSSRRQIRLLLTGLPFGFQGPHHEAETMRSWEELLMAG